MILVDSNILIDWLRKSTPSVSSVLFGGSVAVCGIVEAELLRGTRNDTEVNKIRILLDDLDYIEVVHSDWEQIGFFLRTLREHGISVPFTDAVIAYLAIKHNIEVWTRDNHFPQIQAIVPSLRLFDISAGHSTT